MQIRKYEAVDMPSAVKMIKNELGSDAVILSTRSIRKGDRAFGLFGRAMVEVTAAVDWKAEVHEERPQPAAGTMKDGEGRRSAPETLPAWFNFLKQDLHDIRDAMTRIQSWQEPGGGEQRLLQELNQIKAAVETHLKGQDHPWVAPNGSQLTGLRQRLLVNDVDPETINRLCETIQRRLPEERLDSSRKLEAAVREVLSHIFVVQKGLGSCSQGPKKVALIGPTGAGKTTTIAKLAAAYTLTGKKNVALVTIDTYRIAAIEQLKIYAGIIGIPVDVVVREPDMARTFEKHGDKDLILIDTAGRSHRNLAQMRELEITLGPDREVEKHLVISATMKRRDIAAMLETYRPVGYDYLLFSKIDEGGTYGPILDAVLQSGKPVSYLTDGQRVPEDLREASVKDLVDLILLPGFLEQAQNRSENEVLKNAAPLP